MQSFIKKIAGLIFLTAGFLPVMAQTKPAYEMTVNGIKVIVQPSNNEIVEVLTVFKGGVQNYPADKAGIESLAITALSECGTEKEDKNSFKNQLDKVSANIYGETGLDYSSLKLNCIKSDLDIVWPLYVDALTIPKFDSKEFDRIKTDAINNLKEQSSSPDYSIDKLSRETAFKGKDYAKSPEGTEETVSALTADQTKSYYNSIMVRSRLLIVFVGELDKETIEKKMSELTSKIPAGNELSLNRYAYAPAANTFNSQKKDLATNYIQGVSGAPDPESPDFNAFRLAMRIFSQRNFLEIRTNNSLSYAPYAYLYGGLTSSSNIFVSTTNPDKYIDVMDKLIEKTKKTGFTYEEVKNMKTAYVTGFYSKLETNEAQGNSLAACEILNNNWHRALTINEDLKKVNVSDVNRAFNKYLKNITWVYQGDTSKVSPALYIATNVTEKKIPESKLNSTKN